jgi:hypothetical protein
MNYESGRFGVPVERQASFDKQLVKYLLKRHTDG